MQLRHRLGLAALASAAGVVAALALPSLGFASPNVVAGPIVDPQNGSTYYLVGNTDWATAESEAEQLGGHLWTDNNATEDSWVRDNIMPLTQGFFDAGVVWTGLNDQASEGNFVWASGEATGWPDAVYDTPFYNAYPWRDSGEPNGGTSENCVYMDLEQAPQGGWVDFPCSGADPLLGLVEIDGTPQSQPQTITFTSSPSNPVVGTTYTVSAVGGGSGNPVTFSIDVSSTAGACSIAGSTVTFSAVGTCVVDANQAGGPGYDSASEVQQSIAVGQGTPVVSWSPAGLTFGQPLGGAQLNASASVGGTFVYNPTAGTILSPGAQTLSASFTPTDTTDWKTVGAIRVIFVSTTAPPITGTSNGPLNVQVGGSVAVSGGTVSGPVTVGAGGSLFVGNGTVTGPITINPGGTLVLQGSRTTGPLRVTGGAYVTVCSTTVTGPVDVSGSPGKVAIGATSGCAGNTITGPVSLTSNHGGVSFVGNNVTGPVTITGNTGGFTYSGNTVSGKEKVSNNS
jgi:hypothetical protein